MRPHFARPFLLLAAAALAATLACAASVATSPVPDSPARHAIIVLVDGARWSETFGDTLARWTPNLQRELAPRGVVVREFRNEGVTSTMPGTSAVLTGTWEALVNDGSERAHVPTVFESYRRATGAPATSAWIVTTKAKIATLAASDAADADRYAASTAVVDGDRAAMDAAVQVLARHHPAVMEIHLGDIDARGHAEDWEGYVAAIREADSLVAVLWRAIEGDPELARSTVVFVTNDHGRHDEERGGFGSHGDDCPSCRRVMLLALGAGVGARGVSDVVRRQIDIVPTIGALLGFPTPYAQGTVMSELLAPAPAPPPGDRPAKQRRAQPAPARRR